MKIIHLVSNRVWGGGERYVLDLCRALRGEGRDVEVWCRPGTAPAEVFAADGLLAGTMGLGGMLDFGSSWRLARVMRQAGGDVVVHVHNFKDAATAVAARRLSGHADNVRIVATRHLVKPSKTDRLHTITLNSLDRIVFVSQLAHDVFMSSNPSVDPHRLTVIHNSVAMPVAERGEAPKGPVRLLFAGRVVPEKGLDVLLDALVHIKDLNWTLRICGAGADEYVGKLRQQAKVLGIDRRLVWAGQVSDMQAEFAGSDILVLPTVERESFGLVILEAWSQGVPVVTSDNGAQPEVVTDGENGLLVPPSDPRALGSALRAVVSDTKKRLAMGAAGQRAYRERFGYDRFVRRIKAVYGL